MKASAFLALLALASSVAAAENLDSLVMNAGDKTVYPQASALTIFDRGSVRLTADGETYSRRELLLKIVDERAKDEEGDQSIRFESDHDTVIIEAARTRLPGGQWIEPERDAFTLTSAPEVQWASAYSQLKQQNVSFPGLDVGAAIYLAYRIEPKPGAEKPEDPRAGGVVQFGGMNPVLEKTFRVTTEQGRKVKYEMQNTGEKPFVVFDGRETAYTWQFRSLEQIVSEPGMVSIAYIVPRVVWTTHESWEDLGGYVGERFWAAVDTSSQAIEQYGKLASPDLRGKPALYTAALWISQNIRDVNLPLGRVGYEPHNADRVWDNKYGDPRDKAVLLAAILRGYGFVPIPVLIPNRDVPMSRLPVLEQFVHLLLCVPAGEDTIWLDPTTEYFPPGELPYNRTYGFGCLLVAGSPILAEIPAGTAESRGVKSQVRAALNGAGDLTGTVTCAPKFGFAARARQDFKNLKQQEEDIYFQQAVASFGQGSKETNPEFSDPAELTTPFSISLGFDSPGYAVKQEDLLIFELPGVPFSFASSGFYPSLPEVKYAVQLPGRVRIETEYSITLPAKYGIAYLPAPVIVDNPFVHLELAAREQKGVVTWDQVVEYRADRCPVSEYSSLRQAFQTFALPKIRLALLEKRN